MDKKDFRALCKEYGFTRVESGTRALFNKHIEALERSVLIKAKFQAEHEQHKMITKQDIQNVI